MTAQIIYFVACLSFSLKNDFKSELLELSHHQNRSSLPSYIYMAGKVTPTQVEGEDQPLLGPPSGVNQALSACSVPAVKLTCSAISQLVYSVLCAFLGHVPLHTLATEIHIVSCCRGSNFEVTAFV